MKKQHTNMNSYKSKAVKVIISIVTFLVFVSTGFQDKFTGNWSYQVLISSKI